MPRPLPSALVDRLRTPPPSPGRLLPRPGTRGINVTLRSAAGHLLELELEPESTAVGLKRRVAALWQIPAVFQQLVKGTMLLGDYDKIAALCTNNGKPVSVTLRVAWHRVVQDIWSQADAWRRGRALEALAELVWRDGQSSLTAVSALLEHPEHDVRGTALRALTRVVEPDGSSGPMVAGEALAGDELAALRQPQESDSLVKRLAARSLARDRESSGRERRATSVASLLVLRLGARRWRDSGFTDLKAEP